MPGITIPAAATAIAINASGIVEVKISGQITPTAVGTLELASFPNEAGLEAIGNNLMLETASSGSATTGAPGAPGYGTILQGFLESSNVNAVTEITNLITAQRAYEMNSKVITTADEMMAAVTQLR